LLYLYQASTSIPANSYSDFGLTLLNPNPLACDAAGTIPQFWLADGAYRARMTSANGSVVIFDFDNIQAIGPSTGTGGGAGGSAVDPTAVAQTGDFIWVPVKGIARAGWVMSDARSIGSASSGAAQRANADTQPLYLYLWTNFTDALCPVNGGRGGSAAADFAANKYIATLDMRDYGMFGLGDMGNSDAGRIVTGTPTVAGSAIGAEKATISIGQANIPVYNLSTASLTGSVNTAITNGTNVARSPNTAGNNQTGGGGNIVLTVSTSTLSLTDGTVTFGGTIPSGGSGTSLTPTTISLGRFGTYYVKL
jgi:hypothetical protein